MPAHRKILVVVLSIIFTILSSCEDSSNSSNPGNNAEPDLSADFEVEENTIELADGLNVEGSFEEKTFQIQNSDTEVLIQVVDENKNGTVDSNDILGVYLSSSDNYFKTYGSSVGIGLNIYNSHSYKSHKNYPIDWGYVQVAALGQATQKKEIESGKIYFTFLMLVQSGLIAGKYEITLKNNLGTFKGIFSGKLKYVKAGDAEAGEIAF